MIPFSRSHLLTFSLLTTVLAASGQDARPVAQATAASQPAATRPASQPTTLEQLRALAPLPKTHYSVQASAALFDEPIAPEVREVCRIMGSVPVCVTPRFGESVSYGRLMAAANLAAELDVPLGVSSSPYHYPPGLAERLDDPLPDVLAVGIYTHSDLHSVQTAAESTGVCVGLCWFDIELPAWQHLTSENDIEARLWRFSLMYQVGRDVFGPQTAVCFYASGAHAFGFGDQWRAPGMAGPKHPLFSGAEPLDAWSPTLFQPWDLWRTLETVRRTAEIDGRPLVPCVTLGAGYWPDGDTPPDRFGPFTWSVPGLPTRWAWHSGHMLAGTGELYGATYVEALARVDSVILYPPAFDERCPRWLEHFMAYVRGALGVTAHD